MHINDISKNTQQKKLYQVTIEKKTQSQYTNAAWTTNDRGIFDKESQHV